LETRDPHGKGELYREKSDRGTGHAPDGAEKESEKQPVEREKVSRGGRVTIRPRRGGKLGVLHQKTSWPQGKQ